MIVRPLLKIEITLGDLTYKIHKPHIAHGPYDAVRLFMKTALWWQDGQIRLRCIGHSLVGRAFQEINRA